MWTWLSNELNSPITVSANEPLSKVQRVPIWTSFSMITLPIWGNLTLFLFSNLKPKPVCPINVPDLIITLSPTKEFSITTFDPIRQFFPILTPFLIKTLFPTLVLFPILTVLSIKQLLPIKILLLKNFFIFFKSIKLTCSLSLFASG